MNTKGDMTLNIIMIAIILLITALVVVAIFTGKMGSWGQKIGILQENPCTGQGYSCVDSDKCGAGKEVFGIPCPGGKVCCRA